MQHVELNDFVRAKDLLLQSIRVEKTSGNNGDLVALKYALLAKLHLLLSEKQEGRHHLMNALNYFQDDQLVRWDHAQVLFVISELHLAFGEYQKAIVKAEKAYAIAENFNLKEIEMDACLVLAASYAGIKNYEKAYQFELIADSLYKENK